MREIQKQYEDLSSTESVPHGFLDCNVLIVLGLQRGQWKTSRCMFKFRMDREKQVLFTSIYPRALTI